MDPEEDATNKPWRPIPARKISLEAARALRWLLLPVCLIQSVVYGVPWQGLSLAVAFLAFTGASLALPTRSIEARNVGRGQLRLLACIEH